MTAKPLDLTALSPTPRPVRGRTLAESEHHWRRRAPHPGRRAHVVIFITDDSGFSNLETSASRPFADHGAAAGACVAYNRFHTTLCARLRGRAAHGATITASARASSPNSPTISTATSARFRAHRRPWRASCMTTATTRPPSANGTTRHHSPDAAGPFDQYPTGLGFNYFYASCGRNLAIRAAPVAQYDARRAGVYG